MYSDLALHHFKHPQNVGAMDHPDAVGVAENPVSGATLTLYFRLDAEGRIGRVLFQAQGCAATIASGSAATGILEGRTVEGAKALDRFDIETALGGLPPTRKHAADLVIAAIRAALGDSVTDR